MHVLVYYLVSKYEIEIEIFQYYYNNIVTCQRTKESVLLEFNKLTTAINGERNFKTAIRRLLLAKFTGVPIRRDKPRFLGRALNSRWCLF